jgi:outer membrane murein-binding lipoprotein Lpp
MAMLDRQAAGSTISPVLHPEVMGVTLWTDEAGLGQAAADRLGRRSSRHSQDTKKEVHVRKLVAAMAILAVVFVIGCQDTKKVTELQGQVDKLTQELDQAKTDLATKTVECDSLTKVITDMTAKAPAKSGSNCGCNCHPAPTGKPPKQGR